MPLIVQPGVENVCASPLTEFRIGIDFGGTKIEGVTLDQRGAVVARERRPSETEGGYEHICSNIALVYSALVEVLHGRAHLLGMSAPGATGPDGLHRTGNPACVNGQPWRADLQCQLGHALAIENDGACFAIAEAREGAGRNYNLVFGATLGTGCGGGIVYRGELVSGRQSRAGEWGHVIVDENGPLCMCGRHGCVQTYIAGRSLERRYREQWGVDRSLSDIQNDYLSNDPCAQALMTRFFHEFGLAMANVVAMLDPDVIVLGGGVSNIEGLYTEGAREMTALLPAYVTPPPIVRNELGEAAGALGAAYIGI